MTKYTYYPGCSSQGSGIHLDTSVRSVMKKLGHEFQEIEDWNCCGASVSHLEVGPIPEGALSARNLANARKQGSENVVTPCAACYLNTHGVNEEIREDETFKAQMNEALGAGGLSYDGSLHVRHVCEVIMNDVGMDKVRSSVTKPLKGLKVAGWVGCQTVRPFAATDRGGNFAHYDQPSFLDDMTDAIGAEVVPFENKTACCGGSVAVMNPEACLPLMKKILDEAQGKGAEVIATPCPLCQTNLEMYQDKINSTFGTSFNIPVVFYSQLMAVAFGLDPKADAALHQNTIPADRVTAAAG